LVVRASPEGQLIGAWDSGGDVADRWLESVDEALAVEQ